MKSGPSVLIISVRKTSEGAAYQVPHQETGRIDFLPAAGYRNNDNLNNAGSNGNYWSSSLNTDNPNNASNVNFNSDNVNRNNNNRYNGQSVRPVSEFIRPFRHFSLPIAS